VEGYDRRRDEWEKMSLTERERWGTEWLEEHELINWKSKPRFCSHYESEARFIIVKTISISYNFTKTEFAACEV